MNLSYTLTLEDYKALKLHRKQKLIRRVSPFIWPTLLILSVIGFVFASLGHHQELAASIALGAGALTVTILLPALVFYNTRRCFKQLSPPSRADRTSYLHINEERILSKIPGVSEGKILWPGVFSFAQDDRVTMIYPAERRFLFFPTSVLTAKQRAGLNTLVAEKTAGR
jgi:hypothetical protein